jgi:hypothetical protein
MRLGTAPVGAAAVLHRAGNQQLAALLIAFWGTGAERSRQRGSALAIRIALPAHAKPARDKENRKGRSWGLGWLRNGPGFSDRGSAGCGASAALVTGWRETCQVFLFPSRRNEGGVFSVRPPGPPSRGQAVLVSPTAASSYALGSSLGSGSSFHCLTIHKNP